MGNTNSFQEHIDFKDLQSNYTYEKKYNDSRFGEIKLLKEKSTGQKVFQKDSSSSTPKEFEDYLKEINDATALAHPNVLRVYGYNSKKEDLFCADFYKLSLFFESFETDLEQEITKRAHKKEYFPENELWYILDSIASACAYLQKNHIAHRDIRPFNVFITASRDYKITHNLFKQSYNPGFFGKFDGPEAQAHYYSPELLRYFSKPENQRVPFDEYKNDVFALGMTMLEAGLLEKVPGVYNFNKYEVKEAPIKEALDKLRNRYSPNFVKTVQSALDFRPEVRLDFTRLDKELGVYRRDIREQARGVGGTTGGSPSRTNEVTINQNRPVTPTHQLRSVAPTQYQSDELDQRVYEAVRKSEEVIKKSSPTKYTNKNLDPYIQDFLRNGAVQRDQPLLHTISPYLTSESKYTTTLTIEQPNYGRESQPINFNQPQPREDLGDIKRSGYADLGPNIQGQTYGDYGQPAGNYGQPGAFQSQSGASFGQPGQAYGQTTSNYGQQPYGTYGQQGGDQGARRYGQPEFNYSAGTNNLGQSGLSQNYGSSNYPAGNYGATSVGQTPKNQVDEADELSRKIQERLNQSKQILS